jgi:hypothetical protein
MINPWGPSVYDWTCKMYVTELLIGVSWFGGWVDRGIFILNVCMIWGKKVGDSCFLGVTLCEIWVNVV